jgi:hypothetical protein
VIALALALAGCNSGGDDAARTTGQRTEAAPPAGTSGAPASPADARAIRALLTQLFKSSRVEVTCQRSLTPRLFRRIYTGLAACKKVETEDAKSEDKPTKSVVVTDIKTDGGRGAAHARLVGGDTAGAMGLVALVKGAHGWRVDDLDTPFLRSALTASLQHDKDIPRNVSQCINAGLARLDEREFKTFAYGLFGHRPRATLRLYTAMSKCDQRKGGKSVVRHALEREIGKQLRKAGADPGAVNCVLRRLRVTLPDKEIIKLTVKDDSTSRDRITREVVAAAVVCGAGRGRPDPRELSPA